MDADQPALRIAVIGNSNSAMTVSFTRTLAEIPNVTVTNRSIGGTPNVLVLDFLAHESDFDYDFIIVETAVCDFLQRGSYPLERSRETFELFISYLRLVSNAQVIIMTIPTRYALLEPGLQWHEPLYREVAEKFDTPILDGFRLVKQLVGLPRMEHISMFMIRTRKIMSSFGLPHHLVHSLAWHSLRDQGYITNALGIFGFVDHAHLAAPLHALVGSLLRQFICSNGTHRSRGVISRPDAAWPFVMESKPSGSRYECRKSSLISRTLLTLSSGETTRYHCPPGYRAFGLLVNCSGTFGDLSFRSPAGSTTLDLRFGPQPHGWVAIIVPIVDTIGDGDIEMTVMPESRSGSLTSKAELGELILVRSDWREYVPVERGDATGAFHILDAPEAKAIIADATAAAHTAILGLEANSRPIDGTCLSYATNLMSNTTTVLSHADRARVMVAMGMMDKLSAFLDAACAEQTGDTELEAMRAGLDAIRSGDQVLPNELLRRAIDLANSGATDESDPLLVEGMARFMGHIDFFVEYAQNAIRRKDWPEAQRRWSRVQTMFPRDAVGYNGSAASLREMGRNEDATSELTLATELFPNQFSLFVDLGWLQYHDNKWELAAHTWEVTREKFPDLGAGYVGGAVTYQALRRFADADTVIVEGKDRLPGDREIAFWWADLAAQRGDWREAATRWLVVREVFPTELRCVIDAARALTLAGEPMAADALVFEAEALFPNDPRVLCGWADAADHKQDWPVAAERWKRVRERFPTEKRAYRHEVRARAAAGDLGQAADVARLAVELFHDQVDIISQAATIAASRGDWAAAAEYNGAAYALDRRDMDVLKRYVAALTRTGERSQATIVLDEAIATDPRNETLVRWRIESAVQAKDFEDALNVWHRLVEDWPGDQDFPSAMTRLIMDASPTGVHLARLQNSLCLEDNGSSEESVSLLDAFAGATKVFNWESIVEIGSRLLATTTPPASVYSWLFDALCALDRRDEAADVLDRGLAVFPNTPEILLKRARYANMRGDYIAAAPMWLELYTAEPNSVENCSSAAHSLQKVGDIDGALRLLKDAMGRNGATVLGLQYVTTLLSEYGPAEARAAWLDIVGDNTPTPEQAALRVKIEAAEEKDLMMCFESLGGRVEGCEFGLVQRHHGAEPLGLLRWSDMAPSALIAALEQNFEGVGDPATTTLSPAGAPGGDWSTQDTRFGMNMHTFLHDKDTAENRDRLFRSLCRRLQFLKRKLLEDLSIGDKVFVYKITYGALDRDTLDLLHRAVRMHGPSTLLYVRQSDEEHPPGTVVLEAPGLLIGYIERFSYEFGDSPKYIGAAPECWLPIVKRAHEIWRGAEMPERRDAVASQHVQVDPSPG